MQDDIQSFQNQSIITIYQKRLGQKIVKNQIEPQHNATEAFEKIYKAINLTAVELRKININGERNNPQFTEKVKQLTHVKQKADTQYKGNKTSDEKYKKVRNMVNQGIEWVSYSRSIIYRLNRNRNQARN